MDIIMQDCLFCKIIKGEIPSNKVYEDEDVLAFYDINPAAPIHILVIPKKHITSLAHLEKEDEVIVGKIYRVINEIAQEKGFKEKGYRVIVNCGKDAGQEVMHLHFHLLGGKVILAHPYKYSNFKGKELVESVIKDNLVDGIECFHSYNSEEEINTLLKYAIDNDLYISAGSDYHNAYRRINEYNRCCDIGYLDSIKMTIEKCVNKKQKIR